MKILDWKNFDYQEEIISAGVIILLVAIYLMANFWVGIILPLYFLVMGISVLVAFFYPRSGLYAIIFLTFIFERFFTLGPLVIRGNEYKIYPLDILLVAVLLGVAAQFLAGRIKIKFQKSDYLISGFILFSLFYFLASYFLNQGLLPVSFSTLKSYSFYPLLYFVAVYLINEKKHLKNLFGFCFLGALGIIFFIFYGFLHGQGLWSEVAPLSTEGNRLLAFTHALYISLVLVPLVVYLILESPKQEKFYWFLTIIWFLGIVGTMMRHLWIGLAVAFAFVFWVLKEQRKKIWKISFQYLSLIMVILVIAFYIAIVFPYTSLAETVYSLEDSILVRVYSLSQVSADESLSWRSIVWTEAFGQYLQSPILGIGFGKVLSVEIGRYRDLVEVRNIHNSALAILVQLGLAGTFLFLSLVWVIFKKVWQIKNRHWAAIAILALIVYHLVAFQFQLYLEANLSGIFFWIILGLARVLPELNLQKTN